MSHQKGIGGYLGSQKERLRYRVKKIAITSLLFCTLQGNNAHAQTVGTHPLKNPNGTAKGGAKEHHDPDRGIDRNVAAEIVSSPPWLQRQS